MFKRCLGAVFLNIGHEDLLASDPAYFGGEKVAQTQAEAVQYLFGGSRCVWNCECYEVRGFVKEVLERQRMASPKNPLHIFVDEAHLVAPRGSIDLAEAVEKGVAPNDLGLIATNGRRWNLQCVWITQRPQFMDPIIYRTAEYKIFFRLDPGDLLYFKSMGITLKPKSGQDWEVKQS